MILFYNLSACVCDYFLGTHEFSAFNFILKIGCDTSLGVTLDRRYNTPVGTGIYTF